MNVPKSAIPLVAFNVIFLLIGPSEFGIIVNEPAQTYFCRNVTVSYGRISSIKVHLIRLNFGYNVENKLDFISESLLLSIFVSCLSFYDGLPVQRATRRDYRTKMNEKT